MNVSPSARWSIYAAGAAATLAAVVWVSDAGDGVAVVQPAARSAPQAAAVQRSSGNARQESPSPGLAQATVRRAQDPTADPFAVRAGAPDQAAAVVAPRALPTARQAPAAPAMPFVYLGSWKERGKTSIFVQREDRAYKVDGPGPLDSEYAVQSIDERRITFNYLPLGIVQELRFDAPPVAPTAASPTAATVRGAVQAPGGSPEPDQGEN